MLYKDRKRYYKNGYVVVEYPEHPKAFDTGTGIIGVYEHVLIAESKIIDRPLLEGEVVHHMDLNRSNNSPDNLLVLTNPMHTKLHGWMDKNVIQAKEKYQTRTELGCIRCLNCELPISPELTYCSQSCFNTHSSNQQLRAVRPSKEELHTMLWEKPTTEVAKEFGVSDVSIAKWAKAYEIEKPPRGYWAKKKAEEALKDL